MAVPVLATKLYTPPPPSTIVARPRLLDRLNNGLLTRRGLTLISAPAGFGKTTLITEWIASGGRPAAWLSLDEKDNEPARFLIYLISALQKISPGMGTGLLDILQAPQSVSLESILTVLLNDIASIEHEFILVLDDYHLVDARPVDELLTFLIDHLPSQMHLVITTREDPALPVPRLRARNQLTELRAADLRFSVSEATEFLNRAMDLHLSEEEVAALETRTEGWIAGLQLAALSMSGQQDVHGFIQAFAGDHRYIVDYLVEEVLRRQPEELRSFLLQTSILDRLNSSLCDAVTLQTGSSARLERLQRGNLFLIPLDDKRHWYRYHHLFADVLRMHLMAEQTDQVPALHQRASEWYQQNGFTADAVHHALLAQDYERAAALIEGALPVMRQTRQEATLLNWLQALPEEVFKHRHVLNLHYAGTLLQNGQMGGVESRLRDVELWLDSPADTRGLPVYVNEEEFQRLPGAAAMYRAAISLAQGDADNSMRYARKVLKLVREDDDFMRGAASSLLGLASWTGGDLETAYQMFSKGMTHLERTGFISDVIGGAVTLADIRITQGRLSEAQDIYERGLQLAAREGGPPLRGAADMHVGMSELHLERNDLQAAAQHLMKSEELGELNGLPKNPYRWRVAMARIHETRGELDEALGLLSEAEPLFVSDFSPNFRPVSAMKARVWITQRRLDKAHDWARQQGLSVGDELRYLHEFEHITLARILLAQYKTDHKDNLLRDALQLLERLRKAAEEGGRLRSVIEILILQARAHQMQGNTAAAFAALAGALELAEPEGYVRMFVDGGPDVAALIRKAVAKGILPGYTGKLLSAFEAEDQGLEVEAPRSASPDSSVLAEPLSQRELDILRLFRTELSGPEIARELVIALSTIRTHTKSIYSKLNVNSRRAAVKRAMELGLI